MRTIILSIILLLTQAVFATDISTAIDLYAIRTSSGTRAGSYTLTADIDLEYTDGYTGGTSETGVAIPALAAEAYTVGDYMYSSTTMYVCTTAKTITTWQTATAYVANDVVSSPPYGFFKCISPHTSSAFMTDWGPPGYKWTSYTPTDHFAAIGSTSMGWVGIGSVGYEFTGTFDGGGHTISNIYQTNAVGPASSAAATGLFGRIEGGSVSNLTVEDFTITSTDTNVGAMAAILWDGTGLVNCHSVDCSVTSTKAGATAVGGLVGQAGSTATACSMLNCSATNATVVGPADQGLCGGLSGTANAPSIVKCFAKDCTVTGKTAGGFASGSNGGTITNCYAVNTDTESAKVTGAVTSGGFLGDATNNKPTITNCYCAVKVSDAGTNTAPFIGLDTIGATIASCYYDDEIDGIGEGSYSGTGKTTDQLKHRSTYTGWDFGIQMLMGPKKGGIWDLGAGLNDGYPTLITTINHPSYWWPGIYTDNNATIFGD